MKNNGDPVLYKECVEERDKCRRQRVLAVRWLIAVMVPVILTVGISLVAQYAAQARQEVEIRQLKESHNFYMRAVKADVEEIKTMIKRMNQKG